MALHESSAPLGEIDLTPSDPRAAAQSLEPQNTVRSLLPATNATPTDTVTSRVAAQATEPQRDAPSVDDFSSTTTTPIATAIRADAQYIEPHQTPDTSLPPSANNEPADTSIARGPILGLEDTAATSPPQLERLNIAEPSDSTPAQGTPAPKSPALTEHSTPRADAQISEPQPSTLKSSTLPSTSRNPTSLSAPRRQHTPASSTSSPASAVPPKRERLSQPEAMPTLDEAEPHMAGPPLPPTTPDNYTNAWVPITPGRSAGHERRPDALSPWPNRARECHRFARPEELGMSPPLGAGAPSIYPHVNVGGHSVVSIPNLVEAENDRRTSDELQRDSSSRTPGDWSTCLSASLARTLPLDVYFPHDFVCFI